MSMNNKKLLGKRIKELRKKSKLTQEDLAEMVDIETSTLSGIESGRHFPSLFTLEKIASSLNLELKTFFDFNHLDSIYKMKSVIINNIDRLEDSQIVFIYKFFDGYNLK